MVSVKVSGGEELTICCLASANEEVQAFKQLGIVHLMISTG